MRVLVTGATGFLGRHVVHALAVRGHEVRAIGRRNIGGPVDHVESIQANILEYDLREAVRACDAVVHLAALMIGNAEEQHRVAVDGTERLLDAMEEEGVDRLIHISSFSVYDWLAVGGSVSEDSPLLDPEAAKEIEGYARAKLAQERLVRERSDAIGLLLTVLRPASVWGEDQLPAYHVGQAMGPILWIIAPLRPLRLIYVENCAAAITKACESQEAVGKTINLVASDRVTAWRLGTEIAKRWGKKPVPLPYWPGRLASGLAFAVHKHLFRGRGSLPGLAVPRRYSSRFRSVECDNDRMKRLLGWKEGFTFERALLRADAASDQGRVETRI